jgi:hypothetical protein
MKRATPKGPLFRCYLNELHLPARRLRMDEGRFVEQRSAESV